MKKAKNPAQTGFTKNTGGGSLTDLINSFKSAADAQKKPDTASSATPQDTKQQKDEPVIPVYSKTVFSDLINRHDGIIKKIRANSGIGQGSSKKISLNKPHKQQTANDTSKDTRRKKTAAAKKKPFACGCALPVYPASPGNETGNETGEKQIGCAEKQDYVEDSHNTNEHTISAAGHHKLSKCSCDSQHYDSPGENGDSQHYDSPRENGDGQQCDRPRENGDGQQYDSSEYSDDKQHYDNVKDSDVGQRQYDSPRDNGSDSVLGRCITYRPEELPQPPDYS